MNYLSIALLVTVGLVANTVNAQENGPAPAQNQSAGLVTQPASIRSTGVPDRGVPSYSSDQLNGIAGSIRVKPSQKTDSPIKIPDSINQVLVPPAAASTSVDPIDFFKIPAPGNGIKVRVDGGQR